MKTRLEYLRKLRAVEARDMADLFGLSLRAYRHLERGNRRPTARLAFCATVVSGGMSWEMLMEPMPPRTRAEARYTLGEIHETEGALISRWRPGFFRQARARFPMREMRGLVVGGSWEGTGLIATELLPELQLKNYALATGRIDRWIRMNLAARPRRLEDE